MGVSIGDIVSFLRLDDKPFRDALKQAEGTAKEAGGNMGTLLKAGLVAGIAAAGVAVVAGLKSSIDATVEWSNQLEKLSRELGISTEEAASLVDQAGDLGVGVDALSSGFGIFAKNLAGVKDMETAVAEGGSKFEDVLAGLAVNMTDASGATRSMTDVLPEIADRFASMPDGVQKTALSMQLFGKGGKDLIPVLNQGGEAMRSNRAEVEKLGLAMSGEQVAATRAYQVAMDDLGDSMTGIKIMVANAVMPALANIAGGLKDGIVRFREWVSELSNSLPVRVAIVALGDLFTWLGGVVSTFIANVAVGWGLLTTWLGDLVQSLGRTIGEIASFLGDAFGTIVDLVIAVWSGIVQIIGGAWDAVSTVVHDALKQVGELLSPWLSGLSSAFSTVWKTVVSITGSAWHWIWDTIGKVIAGIMRDIANFIDALPGNYGKGLSSGLRSLADTIGNNLGDIATAAVKGFIADIAGASGEVGDALSSLLPQEFYGPQMPLAVKALDLLNQTIGNIRSTIDSVIQRAKAMGKELQTVQGPPKPSWLPTAPGEAGKAPPTGGSGSGGGSGGSSLTDPLEAAARLLAAITDAIDKALAAFAKLAKYDISKEAFARGWALLLDQIKLAIASLGDMLKSFGFEGEAGAVKMESLGILTSLIASLGDMVSSISSGLATIVKWSGPAKSQIDILMGLIEYIVQAIVTMAAKFQKTGLEQAGVLADTASKIGAMIAAVAEPFKMAAEFKRITAGAFSNIADAIERWVTGMVWLASRYKTEGLDAARDMAATAQAIGQMLAAVLVPMAEAAKFKAIAAGAYSNLADAIDRWVKGMVWLAAKFTEDGLAAAQNMAATAAAIGQALAAVMQPFIDAAKFKVVAPGAFTALADSILRWVQGLAYLKGEIEKKGWTLEGAAAMAASVQAVAGALGMFITAILAVVEYEADARLPEAVTRLINDIKTVVEILYSGFSEWPVAFREALANTITSEGLASQLLSPLSSMISALVTVAAYEKQSGVAQGVRWLIEDWASVLGWLLSAFQEWGEDFQKLMGRDHKRRPCRCPTRATRAT